MQRYNKQIFKCLISLPDSIYLIRHFFCKDEEEIKQLTEQYYGNDAKLISCSYNPVEYYAFSKVMGDTEVDMYMIPKYNMYKSKLHSITYDIQLVDADSSKPNDGILITSLDQLNNKWKINYAKEM